MAEPYWRHGLAVAAVAPPPSADRGSNYGQTFPSQLPSRVSTLQNQNPSSSNDLRGGSNNLEKDSNGKTLKGKHKIEENGKGSKKKRKTKKSSNSGTSIPICKKCGRFHRGECLKGMNVCYCCGKEGHFSNDCTQNNHGEVKVALAQPKVDDESSAHCKRCGNKHNGECLRGKNEGRVAKDCIEKQQQEVENPLVKVGVFALGLQGTQEVPGICCMKCGKKHEGECLKGKRVCHRCRKAGHLSKDCTQNQQMKVEKQPNGVFTGAALTQEEVEDDPSSHKKGFVNKHNGECLRGNNKGHVANDFTENQQKVVENPSVKVRAFALGQLGAQEDLGVCCMKCGKKHEGECLKGKRVCYRCRKAGHLSKDCTQNQQVKVEKQPDGVFTGVALTQEEVEDEPNPHNKGCETKHNGECLRGKNEGHFAKDCTENQQQEVENSSVKIRVFPLGQQGAQDIPGVCCMKCAKKHEGECLKGKCVCYCCRKAGHLSKDCTQNQQVNAEKQPNGIFTDVAFTGEEVEVDPNVHCKECGKKHNGECLHGNCVCYHFGNEGHFAKDCTQKQHGIENQRNGKDICCALTQEEVEDDCSAYVKECEIMHNGEILGGKNGHLSKDCHQNPQEKVENLTNLDVGIFALTQQEVEEKPNLLEGIASGSIPRPSYPGYLLSEVSTLTNHNKLKSSDLWGRSSDFLQKDILSSHPGAHGIDGIADVHREPSVGGLTAGANIRGYTSFQDPNLQGYQCNIASAVNPSNPGMTYGRPNSTRTEGFPVPAGASNTLFVDGLPTDCSRREIGHLFRPFIGFRELRVIHKEPRHSGDKAMVLCFVEFTDAKCALTAKEVLQGYKFDDKKPDSPVLTIHSAHFPFHLPSGREDQRFGIFH